ncbi:sulfite exporter TauE/SafE family protein [Terrisporobacter mayombei]|nr:sulfite exporter TauE/SafE family protein [Terrisporobacter mayombei]
MSKITKFFDVYGMKCHSCESTVEHEINQLSGISSIQADHENSMVIVTYDNELCSDIEILNAIKNCGFSNKNNLLLKVLGLSILVISMFFLGNNPLIGTSTSYILNETSFFMLFALGIFTSFHCIGMCGGIILTQTFNKYDKISSLKSSFLYNLGRVISYTILGGIIGALGSVFASSTKLQSLIQLIAALFMIISGLNMIGIKLFKKFTLPSIFNKSTCVNNHKNPFIIGYLNGFLPCGPLQTMQLYALSSGSFIMGASSMFVFSLGTVPVMLGFAYLSSKISERYSDRILKYAGLLIIIFGLFMIKRSISII